MKVRVLFFAGLRDLAGKRELVYDLEENSNPRDLLTRVFQDFPAMVPLRETIRIAVNEEYVPPERPLTEGDMVALIPPVSGG